MTSVCVLGAALISAFSQAPQMPAGVPADWLGNSAKWSQAGRAAIAAAPPYIRSGGTYEKLHYLFQQYSELLARTNTPFNGSLLGRFKGATNVLNRGFDAPGDWTCGSHAANLEAYFGGYGGPNLTFFQVRGSPKSYKEAALKGVNSDHGCLFVLIDNVPVAFDAWLPAYMTNKTYRNSMQNDFGGIPANVWEWYMNRIGYHVFTTDSEWWGNVWKPTVLEAIKRLAPNVEATPRPKPERRFVAPHWKLEEISIHNAYRDDRAVIGALYGRIWFWEKFQWAKVASFGEQTWRRVDAGGQEVFSRAQLVSAMAPHAAALIPGTKLNLASTLFENVERPFKTGVCYVSFGGQHFANGDRKLITIPDSTALGRYDLVSELWRQSSMVEFPVPQGRQGEWLFLQFVENNGTVQYEYSWSNGGTPPPTAKEAGSFDGRWSTAWGTIELKTRGTTITGSYPHDGGKINGVLQADGKTMKGTWSELPSYKPPADGGDLEFVLSDDGMTFKGQYWYGARKEGEAGSSWDGKRL